MKKIIFFRPAGGFLRKGSPVTACGAVTKLAGIGWKQLRDAKVPGPLSSEIQRVVQ